MRAMHERQLCALCAVGTLPGGRAGRLNSGFVLRSESVSLDWTLDYHFEIYESKEVHPAGSLISLPALSFSNDHFYNFVVAVQFV